MISLRTLTSAIVLSSVSVFAASLPVAEDTFSSPHGTLTPANGKAPRLLINGNQAALIKFDLASLPTGFTATNIAGAKLRLYIVSTRTPSDLTAKLITSTWRETAVGNTPVPQPEPAIISTVPASNVRARNFATMDVTAAVSAALDNTNTTLSFLLQSTAGQTYIASKEGPSQGAPAELEIDANLAQNNSGSGSFPGTLAVGGGLSVGGNLDLAGTFRQGSETGTSEPAGRGIIIRRIQSTNAAIGSVIARTDNLTLERDGTVGGWRIINSANPGNLTIAATGLDANNTPVNQTIILGPNPYPAGTNILFANAQNVVYFRCSFGDAASLGHHTDVSLIRSPNNNSSNWVGNVISSYNQ